MCVGGGGGNPECPNYIMWGHYEVDALETMENLDGKFIVTNLSSHYSHHQSLFERKKAIGNISTRTHTHTCTHTHAHTHTRCTVLTMLHGLVKTSEYHEHI